MKLCSLTIPCARESKQNNDFAWTRLDDWSVDNLFTKLSELSFCIVNTLCSSNKVLIHLCTKKLKGEETHNTHLAPPVHAELSSYNDHLLSRMWFGYLRNTVHSPEAV